MVVYFDTSAFLPMLIPESGSGPSKEIWEQADDITSTRLMYVEAVAAVSRITHSGRSTSGRESKFVGSLNQKWRRLKIIELEAGLMVDAAACSFRFGLRGYDAVHCAAAALVNGPDLVAASSDRRLLEAWSELGVATFDPRG